MAEKDHTARDSDEQSLDDTVDGKMDKLEGKWEQKFNTMTAILSRFEEKLEAVVRAKGPDAEKVGESGHTQGASSKKRRSRADSFEWESDSADTRAKMKKKRTEKRTLSSSSSGEISSDEADAISIPSSDEDMWKEIENDLDEKEKTSENVRASLAEVANKCFRKKLPDEKLKEKFDKIKRPENCDNLQVPTVNPLVWKKLPLQARKTDLRLAQTQRAIVKAATALVHTTQMILHADSKGKSSVDKALKKSVTDTHSDALLLLGHAATDLSHRRRLALRPFLGKEFAGLCSDSVPITSQLFGDDLAGSLKEAREMERIGSAVAGTSGVNWGSHKRHRHPNTERRGFLGQANWRQKWRAQKKPFYSSKQSQKFQYSARK